MYYLAKRTVYHPYSLLLTPYPKNIPRPNAQRYQRPTGSDYFRMYNDNNRPVIYFAIRAQSGDERKKCRLFVYHKKM